jgi:predicted transcriptional regulator
MVFVGKKCAIVVDISESNRADRKKNLERILRRKSGWTPPGNIF